MIMFSNDEARKQHMRGMRILCEEFIEEMNCWWLENGCPHPVPIAQDRKLYLAIRFQNWYTEVLNSDYDCNYDYLPCIMDEAYEGCFADVLNILEGVEIE